MAAMLWLEIVQAIAGKQLFVENLNETNKIGGFIMRSNQARL